ncbi:hypothetical protein FACS189425_06350 [Clostridia bacterium]|nr:hypothetical protein FACS189425_06350 [Clostridia bacterium]
MDTTQTIKVLSFLRDADKHAKFYRARIAEIEAEYYTPKHAAGFDSPAVSSGGPSDPTAATALKVPAEIAAELMGYESAITAISDVKQSIMTELNRLSYTYKTVIYSFYIQRRTWGYISRHLNYSVPHCKRKRAAALALLGQGFNNNPIISNYEYPQEGKK